MERGLRALRRGLRRADGFALYIAVCNQPRESRRLIRWLGESMPDVTLHTVELDEDVEDPLDAVLDQLPAEPEGPVMVLGLERSNPSNAETRPVLYALNLGRAEWSERLPQPVVLWLPAYLLGLMGREAPDFLDWRSDTVHFPLQAEIDLAPVFQSSWSSVTRGGDLSKEQRQRRVAELQSRLATLPESMGPHHMKARLDWLLELSDHHFILGEMMEAEEALVAAERRLRELQPEDAELDRAALAFRQGRLSAHRGEIRQATEAFESAAASFEKAGKDREHALALGETALLHAQSGEVQRALQLHKEALQTYETLGDVRSRAITLGDIARLEAQSGDFPEADELYQEALDIFEQIGDVRSRAGALGDVLRLKAQVGDFDSARELAKERLAICRRLGDVDGIGVALFDLAQLDLMEENAEDALPRLNEAWKIANLIGRVDLIGYVGLLLGQLLAPVGQNDEAEQVLARSEAAFRKLGRQAEADEVRALREELEGSESE